MMEQMMKHANNELLSDQEFVEEIVLLYTDAHRKRYIAENNMISRIRAGFKRGDAFAMDVLDTIFPVHLSDTVSREQFYRQQIAMERMEKRMKDMEECMKENPYEKIRTLKEEIQEKFYDCQAELIQQKEYVVLLQAEEAERKKRMELHAQKIKDYLHTTNYELEGINQTLLSLTRSPFKVIDSVNGLKERKNILLKQKQNYTDLLGFLE